MSAERRDASPATSSASSDPPRSTPPTDDYAASEMMTVIAARELNDGECVFVGIGLPNVACNLAKRRHAPSLQMIYESGVFGANPSRQPLSIGDPCLVTDATSVCSMVQIFSFYLQRGLIDVGVLGGAQIDRFGNINSTVIGDYHEPKVRLPGSGGACEIAHLARSVMIVAPLRRRTFPEEVDFVTSPGHLQGAGGREQRGIPGGGPRVLVTDKALFRFDTETGEMVLSTLYPGVELDDVRGEIGWDLAVSEQLDVAPPPDEDELRTIREELDPDGVHVGGGE